MRAKKQKSLVLIPARGGSKGIPGKNIKLLGGKPLIAYSIDLAKKIANNDCICVSTDDEAIKTVAENCGLKVPFLRPKAIAEDTSSTYDVIMHALSFYQSLGITFENLILLQPTSPFRELEHIERCLDLWSDKIDLVVSVKRPKSNPYAVLYKKDTESELIRPLFDTKDGLRRQDANNVFEINGAVYVYNVKSLQTKHPKDFTNVKYFLMSEYASWDLDEILDWEIAEALIAFKKSNLLL